MAEARDRSGVLAQELLAHQVLASAFAAYEQWLARAGSEIDALLEEALCRLADGW